MKRIAVVGGGLSGFAGVRGLIDSGLACEITIFDHPKSAQLVEVDQDLNLAKSHVQNGKMDAILRGSAENPVNLLPSSKIGGGWSNYWGATIMPWSEKTIIAANIDVESLHESYNAIGDLLEYQAKADLLRNIFPIFGKYTQRGAISPIGITLLNRFENSWKENTLEFPEFLIGISRLAIREVSLSSEKGCTQCGKCLTGCPFGHIYQASSEHIQASEGTSIKHVSIPVEKITFKDGQAYLSIQNERTALVMPYDHVFISSGPIETFRLLIRSGLISRARISESPLIFVPLFVRRIRQNIGFQNQRISLSELFAYFFKNGDIDTAGQIYELNPQVVEQSNLKSLSSFHRLINYLRSHFAVMMLFLPPSIDSRLEIQENCDIVTQRKKVRINHYKINFKRVRKNLIKMGVVPFFTRFLLQTNGSSYHYASGEIWDNEMNAFLPLSPDGKLPGSLSNLPITILGTTCLPKAVPGPITFTGMANSHRVTKNFGKRN